MAKECHLYFLLSSLLGILSGILIWPLQYVQRASANRWTTHGTLGDRQVMGSTPFRSTSAERLVVAPQESGSGWTKTSLSSILMTRMAHLLMCLPVCIVGLWIDGHLISAPPFCSLSPFPCNLLASSCGPQCTKIRAGEVANPDGLPSEIGQPAAAARL